MSTVLIPLEPASDYERENYGITARSSFVYDVRGKGVHNRHSPHRVTVWDNTRRPNPRNGEPVRYGEYGPIDGGDGKYLDPSNRATDSPITVTLGAECTVLSAHGNSTGTVASGQVYAPQPLTVDGFCVLIEPDRSSLSGPFRVTARPLADPVLTPVA